uniref:Platelet derived growth factor D n=1 Tax=Accipiter nisus TaxID=211598 RepID=A0A8B9NMW2_9AVES
INKLRLTHTHFPAAFCCCFCSEGIALQSPKFGKRESNHLTDLYRKEETISVAGNGCIHSPRFPSSYPRNLLLTWRLHSPESTRIQLAFDNQFGLEEPENDICRYDFVEVEDVSETSTVIRGRWCGHKEVPPRITSRTNQIKITFKSDDYFVAKPGFKICYSLVDDFQHAASETNWESVTSSVSGVSYPSPSVTDPTLTAEALDQTIAAFDTVEDLLKHFNPDSWQEDLENLYTDSGHHYRGRSYHDRKSKGRKRHYIRTLGQDQDIPSLLIGMSIGQVLDSGAHVPVGATGFGLSQVSSSQVIAGHEPGGGRGQLPFLVGSLPVATLSCRVRDKW